MSRLTQTIVWFLALACLSACFDFTDEHLGEKDRWCHGDRSCNSGLACDLSGHCVDPCENVRCSGHGACSAPDGIALCACDREFVPVELECLAVGSENARCGPSLTCDVGLVCNSQTTCVDACSQLDCTANGSCSLHGEVAGCDCQQGFHEANATCVSDCTTTDCSGHGTCNLVDNAPVCTCNSGYTASGTACIADACVANSTVVLSCDSGQMYNFDSCGRRLAVAVSCGARGCTTSGCNPLNWVNYGTSAVGDWTVYQDLSSSNPGGIGDGGAPGTTSLGIDPNGMPAIAYDRTDVNSSIWFRRWTGSLWRGPDGSLASDSISMAPSAMYNPSLAFNSEAIPAITWTVSDGTNGARLFESAWTGSEWQTPSALAVPGPTIKSYNGYIAMLDDATPVVARSQQDASGLTVLVAKRSGSTWTGLDSTAHSAVGTGSVGGLSVDSAGRILVVYNAAGSLTLKRYENGSWNQLGSAIANGDLYEPKLAIDAGDNPIVAWITLVSGKYLAYVKRWNGANWAELNGSASGGGVSNGTHAGEIALATSGDGHPFLAWGESSSHVYLRWWDGAAWSEFPEGSATGEGVPNASGNEKTPALASTPSLVCLSWTSGRLFMRCTKR